MIATRTERDSFGPIEVPADRLWGAQTQRSLQFFGIGEERMPIGIIHALALIKAVAAEVNSSFRLLDAALARAVGEAAAQVAQGRWDGEFPLSVWQTGSGTQTNMNVNEVIANLASQALGGARGEGRIVHANDHVNLGQSSNDVFPSAMHVAFARAWRERLLPELDEFIAALDAKASAFADIIKIGRTHLQDAVPLTLGQEFSGYAAQLRAARRALENALEGVYQLAIGATAVGTGVNTHANFGRLAAEALAARTRIPFRGADNKFASLAGHEAALSFQAALTMLAAGLFKIANDIRWMASGPRAGLGELLLPENEPGSSIMPGKVNPTQAEALTMIAAQVMGQQTSVTFAGASGNFELNVFKPLIAFNVLNGLRLLADGMSHFRRFCLEGLAPNRERLADSVSRSLMLVTALAPRIGYDKAAQIAKHAHQHNLTLREAALQLGYVSAQEFDQLVDPARMIPGLKAPDP
jgi:fumarate hydratase, class II